MRLFIAIPLAQHLKTAITRTQVVLRTRGVQGNFTPEENLHLTLAFIGEYPDPEPVMDGLGAFHQVWWAGIRENPELDAYVKRLRHALAEAGIPYDRKQLSPHITLVRKPAGRGEEALGGLHFDGENMTVERISLFRSDRGKRGMIYTEVEAIQAPTPLLS